MNPRMALRAAYPFLGLLMLVGGVVTIATVTSSLLKHPANLAAVSTAEVVTRTNQERTGQGIVALQRNSLLDHAAQMKAEDMATKGYYAHVSPEGVTPMHWVDVAGYAYLIIGENLVVNRTDAEQVVDAFMGSPGHRANILRKDFTEIGVGVATGIYKERDATFTVQIFAAPYPRAAVVAKAPKEAVKQPAAPAKTVVTPKKPVATTVPRANATAVAPTTAKPSTANGLEAITTSPLSENVKEILKPLLPQATNTTSLATTTGATTTAYETPSFFLNESTPVTLADVSQLETDTTPVPVGSTWTREFQLLVSDVTRAVRAWLPI